VGKRAFHFLAVSLLVALAVPRETLEDRALAHDGLLAVHTLFGVVDDILCDGLTASLGQLARRKRTLHLLAMDILVTLAMPRTGLEDRAVAHDGLLAVHTLLSVVDHIH
jgi:hypothetical protein